MNSDDSGARLAIVVNAKFRNTPLSHKIITHTVSLLYGDKR